MSEINELNVIKLLELNTKLNQAVNEVGALSMLLANREQVIVQLTNKKPAKAPYPRAMTVPEYSHFVINVTGLPEIFGVHKMYRLLRQFGLVRKRGVNRNTPTQLGLKIGLQLNPEKQKQTLINQKAQRLIFELIKKYCHINNTNPFQNQRKAA